MVDSVIFIPDFINFNALLPGKMTPPTAAIIFHIIYPPVTMIRRLVNHVFRKGKKSIATPTTDVRQ